jgi:hypothetical protein
MTKIQNNWAPVIKSFIEIAISKGLKLISVDNGEERIKTPTVNKAVEEVDSVDESHIFFETPEGKKVWAWIVLGNSPEETVADSIVNPLLDKACDEFSQKWEGVPTPKKKV